MGAFTDLARLTPADQVPQALEDVGRAQGVLLATAAKAAAVVGEERERRPTAQWASTEDAARLAGFDMSTPRRHLAALKKVSRWANNQKWASRPKRGILRIDLAGFRRWLDVRRGAIA